MRIIHTDKAPAAVGPYSQAVVTGGLVFTSGQIAIDPADNTVKAVTIEEQTERVCLNLRRCSRLTAADWTGWSRPYASLRTWAILPPSTLFTPNTSPRSRPAVVWP